MATGEAPQAPPGPSTLRSAIADASHPPRSSPARSESAATTAAAPAARRDIVSNERLAKRNAVRPRSATGTANAAAPCARKRNDAASAPPAPHLFRTTRGGAS